MKYVELTYREYYHKPVVFEVDDLTDDFKNVVNVSDDDCFMLCGNYIKDNGDLMFFPLAIGNSANNCKKEIINEDLIEYPAYILAKYDATTEYNISKKLIKKMNDFIKSKEKVNKDLVTVRSDIRLDGVRLVYAPDLFRVGFICGNEIKEYLVKSEKINGSFVEGTLYDEPEEDIGVERGDHVRALPYFALGEYHFLAILLSDEVSDRDAKILEEFLSELSQSLSNVYEENQRKS